MVVGKIREAVEKIVKPANEKLRSFVWDVRFGQRRRILYLRIYIDSPEGNIDNHCTTVSHAVDPAYRRRRPH